jgi:hypothetical protein
VERPEFLKVLQHFPNTSPDEAKEIMLLKANYPFSQLLHALAARVSKGLEAEDSKKVLQLAAVYSADRSVLKSLMESENSVTTNAVAGGATKEAVPPTSINPGKQAVDVASTVLEDLAKLHQLRQNFELLFTGAPVSVQIPPEKQEVTITPQETEVKVAEETKEQAKSKKERIVEIAKTIATPVQDTILNVDSGFRSRKKKKDAMDSFIDQIVVSKQELTPESEKHKEQIEMIDQFIKTQPMITGAKDKQGQNDDLSTIKTGEFGDHIVSETLVEILLKQGKKEKAIEVLKKLIWKFPQKKAYFAAQIEELRK